METRGARSNQLRHLRMQRADAVRDRRRGRRLVDDESQRTEMGAQERVLDAREVLDQRPVRMPETAEPEEPRHEHHQLCHRQMLPLPECSRPVP